MSAFNFLRALALAAMLAPSLLACEKTEASPTTELSSKQLADEQAAIQRLLDAYGTALNASNAADITKLFAQNGVFVPPGAPTATGLTQIRGAFDGVFGAISLNLKFTPAQVVVVNNTYAFATSTSSGTTTVKANGQAVPSSYRELWVFVKEAGQWKIARYMFNQPQ